MSLSPFDSFQSRFVTYLLNRPRINRVDKEDDSGTERTLLKAMASKGRPKHNRGQGILTLTR